MRRIFYLLAVMLLLSGCGGTITVKSTYQQISQEEAKDMMDSRGPRWNDDSSDDDCCAYFGKCNVA